VNAPNFLSCRLVGTKSGGFNRMSNSIFRPALLVAAMGLTGTLALSFLGCGAAEESGSDTAPPDHIINLPVSQGKYLYGITDTIAVDFGEDIDTAGLGVDFGGASGISTAFRGASVLLLYGKLRDHGQNHFPVNLGFTMSLTGLRDTHGNGLSVVNASFQPYTWADSDCCVSKFDSFDSLFASDSQWVDGTRFSDSLVTEGSLDFFRVPLEPLDIDDFKLLRLKGADTVSALLTTRKDVDLKLEVFGPFRVDSTLAGVSLDSAVFTGHSGDQGRIDVKFNTSVEVHARKLGGSFDAPGIYVMRLTLPQDKEGFYRLGLRIRKFH
jgi:hypothetical protein